MPWMEIDGATVHYTPAPGSKAMPEEVAAEIRQSFTQAAAQEKARLENMPTERDALHVLMQAYLRLRELGWRDAVYCPKDGTVFDAIEVGSTGIHDCQYEGRWPEGSWWVIADGDLWPSRPSLFRLKGTTRSDVDAAKPAKDRGSEATRPKALPIPSEADNAE